MRASGFLVLLLGVVSGAQAGWRPDGTLHWESFTGGAFEDGRTSQTPWGSVQLSNPPGVARLTTTSGTEAALRANGDVAAAAEYILEFDVAVLGATADWELLRPIGKSAPWEIDVGLKANTEGSGATWEITVLDANGSTQTDLNLATGVVHRVRVHHHGDGANRVGVSVGGVSLGDFTDRAPSVDVEFMQWGDSTMGGISGDVTLDRIRMGRPMADAVAVRSSHSLYRERFTGGAFEDPATSANPWGSVDLNNPIDTGRLTSLTSEEGVLRANPDLGPDLEYVVEYDVAVMGATSQIELLRPNATAAPWDSDILLRASTVGDGSTWELTVGDAQGWRTSELGLATGTFHRVLVHHRADADQAIEVYVNGEALGRFTDRAPSLTSDFLQWGDSTAGGIFGDILLDNLSIGAPQALPAAGTTVVVR